MDKLTLRKVILSNQLEIPRYQIVPRNFNFDGFKNYVLVGARRAGKSFLLYQRIKQLLADGIGWDEILYLNFEDERLDGFSLQDFDLILETHMEMYGKRPRLFLDEIHNIDGWQKFARRLADSKYEAYITGSNAKMLSTEIATTLGGRYISCIVFPYGFGEYLTVHGIIPDESSQAEPGFKKMFNDYFHNGGFPEAALLNEKRDYLISAYQKIYIGDIAGRNSITNLLGLRVMLKKVAESVKQPISFNRIASVVSTVGGKVSVSSVSKYMEYAVDAWLLLRIRNIAAKLSERENACKYYFIDNGILNALIIDGETSLLENIIAINLLRKYGVEDAVYFYNKDFEVDFYIPEQAIAIQACYSISNIDTLQREIEGLSKICKVLECKKRYILTYDTEFPDFSDEFGDIEVIPVWKWLLTL